MAASTEQERPEEVKEDENNIDTWDVMEVMKIFAKKVTASQAALKPFLWWLKTNGCYTDPASIGLFLEDQSFPEYVKYPIIFYYLS